MSSTNEELPPPPKPRASPLDYRNTDLVSRLLAATPPYLYNMPMVPHSYFFSEMLRSFVQAKSQDSRAPQTPPTTAPLVTPHRRSRKRVWSQIKHDNNNAAWQKSHDVSKDSQNWKIHPSYSDQKFISEKPLELTMNKPLNGSKLSHSIDDLKDKTQEHKFEDSSHEEVNNYSNLQNGNIPHFGHVLPSEGNLQPSDLILPPPPPIWYPPIYPPPYGIDPLHFFIDLRVSGHIYDRKNAKEIPQQASSPNVPNEGFQNKIENQNSNESDELNTVKESIVKQTRHASAFSVPLSKNCPMNLSNSKLNLNDKSESKQIGFSSFDENYKTKNELIQNRKFDVKSLGFENKNQDNRMSTHYIMQNIKDIYMNLHKEHENEKDYEDKKDILLKNDKSEEESNEGDEEVDKKKFKDLTAIVGLELVVDYMKHEKPKPRSSVENTSSVLRESPDLEIVENVKHNRL